MAVFLALSCIHTILGISEVAKIPMITITISSSMRVKDFVFIFIKRGYFPNFHHVAESSPLVLDHVATIDHVDTTAILAFAFCDSKHMVCLRYHSKIDSNV